MQQDAWTQPDTFTTASLKNLSAGDENATIEIYPNPASDILMVAFDSDHGRETTISIYDLTGKLILTSAQISTSTEEELKINISSLSDGYYVAQISNGTMQQTKRFVKQ